jgi:hypothetical protein
MTDDTAPEDFAAFEALATATEPKPEEAQPEAEVVAEPKAEEAPADDAAKDETDGDDPKAEDDEPKKRRSKPASERIAELTARLRERERELEAIKTPKQEASAPEKPNPDDFEFGEADPDYQDKLVDYKLEAKEAEKATANKAVSEQRAMFDKINTGVALAEETAKAKYDDFDAKIAEAVEARAGEPLPQLLTIGIGISPVGGDILYRLATDDAASERLETLAKGGAQTANAMAMALGELEGEYLEDDSDGDLDMTDGMDMARMMGRMRARLKGNRPAPKVEQPTIRLTNAPEPPKERARGGSGQMGTAPDTTDFAAFEKLATAR